MRARIDGREFELHKDKAGEYRFRLNAANSDTIYAPEGYSRRDGAEDGIASAKKNVRDARRDDLTQS